ncbi:radical SAM protein [Patescibacteria group bacterium]
MKDNIYFDHKNHEFSLRDRKYKEENYADVKLPISIIVQVTRRCNLVCNFCSESAQFSDPTFDELEQLKYKLNGVKRIYLSGGEPLLRDDIFDIINSYRKNFEVLGLPSNCILMSKEVCEKLKGNINYINAGLDGPRIINDQVRGNYDGIINGLINLKNSNIEVSLSSVILKLTLPHLKYVIHTADVLDIIKVKMVIPILRGRAHNLRLEDFADKEDIMNKFNEIKELKNKLGWKPRVKFTFWDNSTEGYALIIYPNQKVYAWPVFNAQDSVSYIGDLKKESIYEIWKKYPYKINHINKYVGISMYKI